MGLRKELLGEELLGIDDLMIGIDISGIEATPVQKLRFEIQDHALGNESDPNRFQAVADYADIKHLESVTKLPETNRYSLYSQQEHRGEISMEQLQLAALLETKRQRMNGLPGFETYNWEYQLAEKLGNKLEVEINKERKAGKKPVDLPTELQSIKTFAAEILSLRAVNARIKPQTK